MGFRITLGSVAPGGLEGAIETLESIRLICPTCAGETVLARYVEGQRYGCPRCGASLLFSKFALQKELGRGGFGVVYKAWQVDLHRTVALKFLNSDSEASAERFIREARIAAQLIHPNIAAIYDVGRHEGKLFISMQYIDGQTVNRLELSPREAAAVVRDAALAVDYAHSRGIVHRDLKPHNLMVTHEKSGTGPAEAVRRVYVMDFGLARSVARDSSLTVEGQVLGTPAFMSPEQAEGKPVDARSDVYSLGATLYALAARRPPFEGTTPVEILMKVATGSPAPPSRFNPEIDPDLESIILKAMDVDPERRYPSAGRLAADLSLWLDGRTPDAGATLRMAPSRQDTRPGADRSRRQRVGLAVAVLGALVVAGAGAASVALLSREKPAPPAPAASLAPPAPAPVLGPEPRPAPVPAPPPAPPPRVEVLRLESDPPGASVFVDGVHCGSTPLVLHRDELSREVVQIDFELRGYLPARRTVTLGPVRQDLKVDLEPQAGSFRVQGAAPHATLHVFVLPPEIRAPRAVIGLWSQDPASLVKALESLPPEDLPFVAERLRELAARPEEEIRSRAARGAAAAAERPPAPAVRPERTMTADALGNARIEDARVLRRYRILATAPDAADAATEDLEPLLRQELVVPLAMARLANVEIATRPPVGRFRLEAGGGETAEALPGGPPVRFPAGPVTLRYLPPKGDPLLREFSLSLSTAGGRCEVAGNIYALSARAAEAAGDAEAAIRAYTKALEETAYPASEEPERRRWGERIQALVRSAIEALPRDAVTGDLEERLSEASRRPPAEAVRPLAEIYASRRSEGTLRAAAAQTLAAASARLRRPYEAMEWLERCVREGADPGAAVEGAVAAAIRGFPGLAERFAVVSRRIAELREAASRRPPPPPAAASKPPAAARLGIIQRVHPEYGIFVRLEPETTLALGDVLEVVRDGQAVGEITVQALAKADATYPHGCAVCRPGKGSYQKGDEVRRK